MSRWVHNPDRLDSQEKQAPSGEERGKGLSERPDYGRSTQKSESSAQSPRWLQIGAFFLSGLLFLSGFLVLFSPLPILILFLRQGRKWAWLGVVVNSAIVGWASGFAGAAFYLVLVGVVSLSLPEFLRRRVSVEKSIFSTLCLMALFAALILLGYCQYHHLNPVQEVYSQVTDFMDNLREVAVSNSGVMSSDEFDDRKQDLLMLLPSGIAIFALMVIWINFVLMIKSLPVRVSNCFGLDASYLKSWKAPEWLVWPTIASGAFLVFHVDGVSDVAVNLFQFFMAIYVIQGFSILSFVFDKLEIRGFARWAGYFFSIWALLPLVLSLGFFDLWFDFRSKFRQS